MNTRGKNIGLQSDISNHSRTVREINNRLSKKKREVGTPVCEFAADLIDLMPVGMRTPTNCNSPMTIGVWSENAISETDLFPKTHSIGRCCALTNAVIPPLRVLPPPPGDII